jgi:hypothetical protein
MSDRVRCACRRCTIRSLMGPAIVITVGVLFLLSEMIGGSFSFDRTFPVILIVIGAISLASSTAPADGHISGAAPPAAPVPPVSTPPPPQNSLPGQDQGQ